MIEPRTPFPRATAHKKLDELLDLYDNGAPLRLQTEITYVSTKEPEAKLTIEIRDHP